MEADLPRGLAPAVPIPSVGAVVAGTAHLGRILLQHAGQGREAGRQAEALEARANLLPGIFDDCRRDNSGRCGRLCCRRSCCRRIGWIQAPTASLTGHDGRGSPYLAHLQQRTGLIADMPAHAGTAEPARAIRLRAGHRSAAVPEPRRPSTRSVRSTCAPSCAAPARASSGTSSSTRYHYLGYIDPGRRPDGDYNSRPRSRSIGWPLAMLGFSTAAWTARRRRDNFIGWTRQKREYRTFPSWSTTRDS